VVPKIVNAVHNQEAQDALAAADRAFNHLRVPRDFKALTADPHDCQSYPCYRVPRSTRSVGRQLPAILRSTGTHPYAAGHQACPTGSTRTKFPPLCSLGGLSHGYQVLILLGPVFPPCPPTPCRPLLRNASIVQITPPYIPADAEPWNGGSGWPLK
jgi:hypothetical protein